MVEFLFGVTVGAFACYVILREKINIGGRKVLIVGMVVLALMFIGGLLTFMVAFPVTSELQCVETREWELHPQEIRLPDCLQERMGEEGDGNR
ncbi:hypothetical protein M1N85_02695 [Dehalococcoidia bacterium]|nr:hypothetical protein [Dehalococcoidia bacterium]